MYVCMYVCMYVFRGMVTHAEVLGILELSSFFALELSSLQKALVLLQVGMRSDFSVARLLNCVLLLKCRHRKLVSS